MDKQISSERLPVDVLLEVDGKEVEASILDIKGDVVDVLIEGTYRVRLDRSRIKIRKQIKTTGIAPQYKVEQPVKSKGERHVTLLSTGGTIAGRPHPATGGLIAGRGAKELYSLVPELADIADIKLKDLFFVLSEDMQPQHWTRIAQAVYEEIMAGTDGIVISHGTDTMQYTAAALSFMLQNLPIPIVMVGSQKSIDRPSSDAALNLIHGVTVAAKSDIAEVVVTMFGPTSDEYGLIHRGTRVRKMHTSARSTFRTLGDVPLGIVDDRGIQLLRGDYKKRDASRKPVIQSGFCEKVALVYYHPGMSPEVFEWYAKAGYKGIVIAGTGMGHVSSIVVDVLKELIKSGTYVFMTTQTLWGYVNLYAYQSGRRLLDAGIIPLGNMLPEVAFVKLGWTLSNHSDAVEETMLTPINNEITNREPPDSYLIYQGGLPEIRAFLKRERL